jgi:hypothetical protein
MSYDIWIQLVNKLSCDWTKINVRAWFAWLGFSWPGIEDPRLLCLRLLLAPSYKVTPSAIKKWPFWEGYNLFVSFYFRAFEIWPDRRGDLWWEGSYKGGLLQKGMISLICIKSVDLITVSYGINIQDNILNWFPSK